MAYDPSLSTFVDHLRFQMADIDDAALLFPIATYEALLSNFGYLEALARLAELRGRQLLAAGKSLHELDVTEENYEYGPKYYFDLANNARSGKILAPNLPSSPMSRNKILITEPPDLSSFRTD